MANDNNPPSCPYRNGGSHSSLSTSSSSSSCPHLNNKMADLNNNNNDDKTKKKEELAKANQIQESRQIQYFKSIPWCASLLSSDQGLRITQSYSRSLRPSLEDALVARTLNAPDAIPHYITFYNPVPPVPVRSTTSTAGGPDANDDDSLGLDGYITQVSSLVSLGPMVNGWEGVCHGGMVVTLLDEVMGQLFAVNKMIGRMNKGVVFTGELNTKFLRPVLTGTKERLRVVLVVARLKRVKGRKFWTEAVLMGPKEEEDGGNDNEGKGGGNVKVGELEERTRAEAIFVKVKEKL